MTDLGDIGGWFRTATGVVTPAWEPGDGDFGRISPDADLTMALDLPRGRPAVVLTGADMSTSSGLPNHRGRDTVPCSPMTFQEFIGSDPSHRCYRMRLTIGWNWFETTRPGLVRLALVGFGRHIPLTGVITQNVDGPHQVADSEPVVNLHGNLARVVYLGYGRLFGRVELQVRLLKLDSEVATRFNDLPGRARIAPDGDAEAGGMTGFTCPAYPVYGGILKPDVVYFGENACREVVGAANALFDAAEVSLVLGLTLTVMNGLRFARQAVKQDKDMTTTGDGATRADDLVIPCIHGRLEHILPFWADAFRAGWTGPPFTVQGVCPPRGSPTRPAT